MLQEKNFSEILVDFCSNLLSYSRLQRSEKQLHLTCTGSFNTDNFCSNLLSYSKLQRSEKQLHLTCTGSFNTDNFCSNLLSYSRLQRFEKQLHLTCTGSFNKNNFLNGLLTLFGHIVIKIGIIFEMMSLKQRFVLKGTRIKSYEQMTACC